MKGLIHLSWAHLKHRPLQTAVLIAAVAIALFLPLALQVVTSESSRILQQRAASTPLIVGPKGSAIDLTLASLYFIPTDAAPLPYATYSRIKSERPGKVIPLLTRYHSDGAPIVGTSLGYFESRQLTLSQGSLFTRLGDCVIGAGLAKKRGLRVGDSVISSPENLFDLGGIYPLKMRITGVLAPAHTADDSAIFADVKTTWIIAGLAHGHDELSQAETLRTDGGVAIANASVREFTEVTAATVDSFHFHGDRSTYPLSSLIVLPKSEKAGALLLGRYETGSENEQIVIPATALNKLTSTLFATKRLVTIGFLALGTCALILVTLVYLLSLRLRENEFTTYTKIGAPKRTIFWLKAADALVILTTGIIIATAASLVVKSLAPTLLPALLTS